MEKDYKGRFSDAANPSRRSEGEGDSNRPDRPARIQSWNAFIRRRGLAYKHCRLARFERHGDANDKTRQNAAFEKLMRYGKTLPNRVKRGQGIVLVGPSGTGKDFSLTALARHAILNHGFTVEHIDGAAFFSRMRDRITEELTEAGVMRPLIAVDILYVSDPVPASGALSDYQKDRLFDLIDKRRARGKPTWVSCNFAGSDEADSVLSPQLAGRMRDNALVLGFAWPTYRKPAPKSDDDEWWAGFDDDEPESPTEPVPKPASSDDPGGDYPIIRKADLRDAETVDLLFRNLVANGIVTEADKRGVFGAAAQAYLSTRQPPARRFRELVESKAWTGADPRWEISVKSFSIGDSAMASLKNRKAAA